ncbi:Hypothetical predicted protein [Prunus dulcis]|uniref:Uncharacterized protein n=1 Tax=Prunus dulcis TaxID=3755 RepID=A0A5E4FR23_PRUDU|nr:hypothetical protein L3X38_025783 [Prunus dulcis]VVA29883.1 Hypothetical predicted protein [Prunus dulcis]
MSFDSDPPSTLWIDLPWRKQSWEKPRSRWSSLENVELEIKLDGVFEAEDLWILDLVRQCEGRDRRKGGAFSSFGRGILDLCEVEDKVEDVVGRDIFGIVNSDFGSHM